MDNTIWIYWLVMGIICAFIGGNISTSKGRTYGEGFAFGFFLGIIGLITVAVLPKNENALAESKLTDGTGKKCPYCAEIIKQEAVVCRYCGKELPTVKFITVELQGTITEKKSNPSEIKDDEISKWKAGFSQIGWLEAIGQNTKAALSNSSDEISRDPLLCVTYADVKGSRITGLSFNQTDMFSNFTALIATSQKLIFVQPDKKLVNVLAYKEISKIERGKKDNSKAYRITSNSGKSVILTVDYQNADDEKIVDMFLERITSVM